MNTISDSRKIAALREYFSGCFKKDGSFDMELFREFLADKITITHGGYELIFPGKNHARLLASLDTTVVMRPDEAHNARPENAQSKNIYIRGDNLDGLKYLRKSYSQNIRCIYIDPPYNTGADGFTYNDRFSFTTRGFPEKMPAGEKQTRRIPGLAKHGSASHSAWLAFMYPRLLLARDLLANDGAIFISINDNEQSNLKLLCDDVFGGENFIVCFNWQTKKAAQGMITENMIVDNHEYILAYAKNKSAFCFTGKERKAKNGFSNPDNDPRGVWKRQYLQRLGKGLPQRTITDPKTGLSYTFETPYTQAKLNNWVAKGYIIFPKKAGKYPARKEFLSEYSTNQQLVSSLGLYATKATTEKLYELFGGKKIFTNPKPDTLIYDLLKYTTRPDDTVLDFFSGSGTSAHALMQLNADDNGRRRFIQIQSREKVKPGSEAEQAGFETIDQIGIERLRLAAAKIRGAAPSIAGELDLGFKIYSLAEPRDEVIPADK